MLQHIRRTYRNAMLKKIEDEQWIGESEYGLGTDLRKLTDALKKK